MPEKTAYGHCFLKHNPCTLFPKPMATEYDPNERLPKANPTRWLPWVLLVGLAILIFFLIRGVRNPGAAGGGSSSEVITTRTGDTPREADDPEADTVATDTVGNRR